MADCSELAALLQAVCEDDVRPPSAVAPAQRRQLRSDLDAITLRALHQDPEQRYASVQQLAEDLERYLAGMPVLATESSLRYRGAKFLRRHWKGVLAAGLVGLALLVGLLTTTWQMRVAQSERTRAQTRYQEVRQLANTLLFDLHDAMRGLPGSTRVRQTVIEQALGHLDRLAQEAPHDPVLLREMADGYARLGNVQGNPYYQNLGDLAGALQSHRKALAIRESWWGSIPLRVTGSSSWASMKPRTSICSRPQRLSMQHRKSLLPRTAFVKNCLSSWPKRAIRRRLSCGSNGLTSTLTPARSAATARIAALGAPGPIVGWPNAWRQLARRSKL